MNEKVTYDSRSTMKFMTFIFSIRFWLTLFVSIAFTMGTASADIHPKDTNEIACENSEIVHVDVNLPRNSENLRQSDNDSHKPNHDHHLHHCGTCHTHSLRWEDSGLTLRHIVQEKFSFLMSANAPRRSPAGLFRPPRA